MATNIGFVAQKVEQRPEERGAGLERRAKVFAALSDANRLRIVELLMEREEACGKEVAEALGISLSLYSHHARALREAGLITRRKRGQTGYCSLDRELLSEALGSLNR
ncbi:MAG: metalloregulator ArsR/SmtB family transcription factor [Actinomycetota bacterium]|nr:metalloregulator ArsR/SmtB family transcription factor [Actinomycetota bacterium]